jgi:hypothetical protein
MRVVGWSVFALLVLFLLVVLVPFISFGKSLDLVAADAAKLYGFSEEQYSISFSDDIRDRHGNRVLGMYRGRVDGVHIIEVRNHWLRAIAVGTIFHEFAHAAQVEYNLDLGDMTIEQHAEALGFQTMWHGGYRWDSLHLLTLHTFGGKGEYYRATGEVWGVVGGRLSVAL